MTKLEDFLYSFNIKEHLGGETDDVHNMYCMDGKIEGVPPDECPPDMRQVAGFSRFPCCDFFISENKKILLIELGNLLKGKKNIKNKCKHIPWKYLKESGYETETLEADVFGIYMKEECARKLYASMAMLYSMAHQCENWARHIGKNPKYSFCLVIHSKTETEHDFRELLSIQEQLTPEFNKMPVKVDIVINEKLSDTIKKFQNPQPK